MFYCNRVNATNDSKLWPKLGREKTHPRPIFSILNLISSKTHLKEENLEDESQDNIKGFS